MPSKTFSGALVAQSIEASEEVMLKSILITAAAATATATVTDANGTQIVISAAATVSVSWPAALDKTTRIALIAPVTITTTGSGSFTRVDY